MRYCSAVHQKIASPLHDINALGNIPSPRKDPTYSSPSLHENLYVPLSKRQHNLFLENKIHSDASISVLSSSLGNQNNLHNIQFLFHKKNKEEIGTAKEVDHNQINKALLHPTLHDYKNRSHLLLWPQQQLLEEIDQLDVPSLSQEQQTFLAHTISSLICDTSSFQLSRKNAQSLVADFLYLLDHSYDMAAFSWNEFSTLSKQIGDASTQLLKREKDSYEKLVDELKKTNLYSVEDLRATQYPMCIAKTLLRPNGEIRLALIDKVKSLFLNAKEHRDSLEREIAYVLRQFQSDESLSRLLFQISPPDPGSLGSRIIEATLYDTKEIRGGSQKYTTNLILLSALLSRWRQIAEGGCYGIAVAEQAKNMSLKLLMKDFNDLLTHGYLQRDIQNQGYRFYGIFHPLQISSVKKLPIEELVPLSSITPIQHAYNILGMSQAHIDTYSRSSSLSIEDLIRQETLQSDISSETISTALMIVESPIQMPLLRVWRNAINSMAFSPLTATNDAPLREKQWISVSLVCAFLDVCNEIENHSLEAYLHEKLPQAAKEFYKTVKTTHPTLAHNLNTDQAVEKAEIISTLAHLKVTAAELDQAYFDFSDIACKALKRIRFLYSPHHADSISYWLMADISSSSLEIIRSEKELGKFLKNIFLSIQQAKLKQNIPTVDDTMLEDVLLEKFQLYYNQLISLWGLKHSPFKIDNRGASSGFINVLASYYERDGVNGTKTVHFTSRSEGISQLFTYFHAIRQECKNGSTFSIPAQCNSHTFRLLPNHPSLPKDLQDIPAVLEAHMTFMNTLIKESYKSFPLAVKMLISSSKHILSKKRVPFSREDIVALFRHVFKKAEQEVTLSDAFKQIKNVLQEKYSCLDETDFQEISFHILAGIESDIQSRGESNLWHIADTNWEIVDTKKNQAKYYSLLYDPLSGLWRFAVASEDGTIFQEEKITSITFSARNELHIALTKTKERSIERYKLHKKIQREN